MGARHSYPSRKGIVFNVHFLCFLIQGVHNALRAGAFLSPAGSVSFSIQKRKRSHFRKDGHKSFERYIIIIPKSKAFLFRKRYHIKFFPLVGQYYGSKLPTHICHLTVAHKGCATPYSKLLISLPLNPAGWRSFCFLSKLITFPVSWHRTAVIRSEVYTSLPVDTATVDCQQMASFMAKPLLITPDPYCYTAVTPATGDRTSFAHLYENVSFTTHLTFLLTLLLQFHLCISKRYACNI